MSSDGNSDTASTSSPSGSSASQSPLLDSQNNFSFDKDGSVSSTDDFELHLTNQVHAQIRKATHKLSEKKRRKAINKRYDELKKLLPGLSVNGKTVHSKQTILKHAVQFIDRLKADCRLSERLLRELVKEKERNLALESEKKMWDEKLRKLRESRGLLPVRPPQAIATTATIIQTQPMLQGHIAQQQTIQLPIAQLQILNGHLPNIDLSKALNIHPTTRA
ncbi:max-like protein homolog 2 [Ptychodera flava]|uniref:max-like protein homolog 2 n=1 Tax=Ptychodera flava TaxID=63121 RepID=UPI003969BEE7